MSFFGSQRSRFLEGAGMMARLQAPGVRTAGGPSCRTTMGTRQHRPDRPADRRVARNLEAWFEKAARDLPWRDGRGRGRKRRAYRVWVSEVMLQQTQVKTVIPYYQRWMVRFPTLEVLARAEEQEVLELWAGLGYYRRARNLHRAARLIVDEHGGQFPEEVPALQALPGIGRYSAGAIASLAFGKAAPIVDGNVARVLSRLAAWEGNPGKPLLEKKLWSRASELALASETPGRLNEALMELGALVCTPRNPDCAGCPLRRTCRARATGDPLRFPGRLPSPRRKEQRATCAIVLDRRGAVLLHRRRPGLLGGLWEPPQLSQVPPAFTPRGEIRHIFTHLELHLRVVQGRVARRAEAPSPTPGLYEAQTWTREIETLPLSALARKALALF